MYHNIIGIYSYSNYNFAYLTKIRFDAKYNCSKSLDHPDQTPLKEKENTAVIKDDVERFQRSAFFVAYAEVKRVDPLGLADIHAPISIKVASVNHVS